MNISASPHFTAISLGGAFNARRETLSGSLRAVNPTYCGYGRQVFQGIPFELGLESEPNVILLESAEVAIPLDGARASYLLCLHAVEDRPETVPPEVTAAPPGGNALGDHVADYVLEYVDGTSAVVPIRRRFAIQQSRIRQGASAFEAVPACAPLVFLTASEAQILGRPALWGSGYTHVRHMAGRDACREHAWLYALPNPHPHRPLRQLRCVPRSERALLYGLARTELAEHPLRPQLRQKVRLELPASAQLNALHELEDIALDLGNVLSARAALDYATERWLSASPDVQPARSDREVLVEYVAHPHARLYVGCGQGQATYDLARPETLVGIVPVAPARRPVRLRVLEHGRVTAARLHLHGASGEYLPPRNHNRHVNIYWGEDSSAEFANDLNQYSYIPGECLVELPLGKVFAEAWHGPEVTPYRSSFEVKPEIGSVDLNLERQLDWRADDWVSADTHVHFLSPQTALLEGMAEGVHVVNLLASQWGEMFSNVGDFDGRTTLGAREFGGDGEFLVRVGSENRQHVLGHISLLGYSGPLIEPLCAGGPEESALGDPVDVTLAGWAQQCRQQAGLVVMPHAPDPQCERAADILLGLVDAVEVTTLNPFQAQLNPVGLADWYRWLNLGWHLPLVAGSDKMSANALLGGIRTYAHLGGRPFDYGNWQAAIKAGRTFVTVGPLVDLAVEDVPCGGQLQLPVGGGTLDIAWRVESACVPPECLELVAGGRAVEAVSLDRAGEPPYRHSGTFKLRVSAPTWIAARVRGSLRGRPGEIAAHTSAIQVRVGDQAPYSPAIAEGVAEQILGTLAYLDVLAPRPEDERLQRARATLEAAHRKIHQQLHQAGIAY